MYHLDKAYFDYKVKVCGTTQEAVAKACNCNRSTLRRHFENGDITFNEAYAIIEFLHLGDDDIRRIFFTRECAKMHNQ